jgi:hypothetical protein
MHLDAALIEIRVASGIVDELRHLSLTHLRCPITKDEEKSIDGV